MDKHTIALIVALVVGAITFGLMLKKQRNDDCPS